ncbi:MAG: hypothetical protein J6Z16_03865 [Candidatus Methanomethylophilaceae archaeon]|nr:hypothetical protein [Candidatus Methanomethylophilaceae archaeon]
MDGRKITAAAAALIMTVSCVTVLAPSCESDAATLNDGDSWGLSLEFDDLDDLMAKIREKPGYEDAPKDRLMLIEYAKIVLGGLGIKVRSLDLEGSGDIELAMTAEAGTGKQVLKADTGLRLDGYVKVGMDVPLTGLDKYSGLGEILTNMGVDLDYFDERVTETGSMSAIVDADLKVKTDLASFNTFDMNSAWHIIGMESSVRSASSVNGYVSLGVKELEGGTIVSETTVKEGLDSRFSEILEAAMTFSGGGIQFLPDVPGQSSWSNRTQVSGHAEGSTGYLLPLMADVERRMPQGPFAVDLDGEMNYHGSAKGTASGMYDVSFGLDFPSIKLPTITGEDFANLLEDLIPGLNLSRIMALLKAIDPTMNYDRFFNLLLTMFPNVDVKFPIDLGEILMDNIPDLKYRYPFEYTDIPSFLFVGNSFKIDKSQIPPIEKKIREEDERLEDLLGDVLYPVKFVDGDKTISTVMAGYGKEPVFPDYEPAAGWMTEDGTHWIKGYSRVAGETVLYPCHSKTVYSVPTAADVESSDILNWNGAKPGDSIDLSVFNGQYGKEIVADVDGGYVWDVVSSESSYSGKTLNLGIRNADMPATVADDFERRVSSYLSFDQAGSNIGDAWVTYVLPDSLKGEKSVDMYEVGGGSPVFLRTVQVDDGSIWWKYSGENDVVLAGSELPPEPEKERDEGLMLIIIAVIAVALIAVAAWAISRRRKSVQE